MSGGWRNLLVPVNVANCFQQTMLIGFEVLLSIKDVLSCCMLIVENTHMLLFHRNLLLRTIKYVRKRVFTVLSGCQIFSNPF